MTKVAFPTEDGRTISRHFGQAPFYVVATVQEGEPTRFEQREKAFHGHHPEPHEHGHGHADMFAPISDCNVLIAGGMGEPALAHAVDHGLQVILTGVSTIEAGLADYQAGTLVSDTRRIHKHRPDNPNLEI
jgi:predicted Fe-Mo cluster-binding NifX family protein